MSHIGGFRHPRIDGSLYSVKFVQMLLVVVVALENLTEVVWVTVFTPDHGIHILKFEYKADLN